MKSKIGWALAAGALLMNVGWNPADSPRWSLLGGAAARAQVSVDFGFFHDELAPYGDWRQREPYGWVWFPDVGRNWRPYTFGYWVFTADYGWTWISTDPWGSIPFHYGRWFYDEGRRAWAWVPGTEWGPAWVGWRSGGGYIGWAPLPPSVEFDAAADFAPADRDFGSRWNSWSFVPTGRFLNQGLERFIVPRPRNVALINTTVNVTRYNVINRRIVNRSIDPDRYEEEARVRVARYQVDEISRPVRRERPVRGGRVVLFKPQVVRTELAPPPPTERPRRFGASPESRVERREPGADRPPRNGPGSAGFDGRTGQRPERQMTDDQRQQTERERARQWAERGQRRQADQDSTHQRTEQERTQRQAEREQARQQASQQRQQTEREQARQLTEQERAQRQAERETQRQAEQARRQAERDQARQQQSDQERAQRQAEREQARQQAIQQRQHAEQEQFRQRTEQERAQRQAEREAQRQTEQAQRQAERDAQRQTEQAQRQAEREQARQQAIQQRQQQQQEQQRRRNLPECKSLPPGVQQECR
ncbi:MAG TPA: hypothetical protein PK880_00595 [Candidatus Competibacter sp.]|nr:hypothetical protein [Candidatus Competibacter sp.]